MKRYLIIPLALFFLGACTNPQPTQPIAPSLIPSISPSIVPQPSPTPDTSTWLPALEATIDLGTVIGDPYFMPHPIANDSKNNRLYIATAISQTLVLDAKTFQKIDEITIGGNLSLSSDRLYIGVPGSYDSFGKQISTSELRAYDLSTLKLSPHLSYTDTSLLPAYVLVNEAQQKVYVVRRGVYEVDPQTLRVIGSISGTVPIEYGLVPNYSAVDAAIDPVHNRLIVSLNNGIPGSNGGNGLAIFDLTNNALLTTDDERSVQSIDVDPVSGQSYVVRSFTGSRSIAKYDQQGQLLHRLDGLTGDVQLDAAHQRVYVFEAYPRARLIILDSDLNYQGETRFAGLDQVIAFQFDAQNDRVLMLARTGKLFVLKGHATPDQPAATAAMAHGSIQWLVPSPDYANDHNLFAAFAATDYVVGAGALFHSLDDGKTWQAINGLPMSDTVSAVAFSPNYANDHTLYAALGSSTMLPGDGSGVFRSADDGRTWSVASHGLTDLAIKRIVAADAQTLFAVGMARGLFLSSDRGQTWVALADRYMRDDSYARPILNALAVSPDYAHDKTVIISKLAGGIQTSHDGGETWQLAAPGGAAQLGYLSNGNILAALQSGGVIRSADNGDHWVAASTGLDLQSGSASDLAMLNDHAIILMTEYGARGSAYELSGANQTWGRIEFDQPVTLTAAAWVETASHTVQLLIGTADGRVLTFAPGNLKTQSAVSLSIKGLEIQSVVTPDGQQVFIGGGSFGVWKSEDGGSTWQDTGFPDRGLVQSMQIILSPDYNHDSSVYATAGQGLYRSRDGGQTWALLNIPASAEFAIGALTISPNFANDQALIVGGDYRSPTLWQSIDQGETFTPIQAQIVITPAAFTKLLIAPDGSYWAWLDYTGLFRSDDRGQTWLRVLDRSDAVMQSMAYDPQGSIYVGLLYGSVLRSINRGRTWEPIGQRAFANHTWISVIVFSPDDSIDRLIWIGTDDGIFRSGDGGAVWHRSDDGLPPLSDSNQISVLTLAISPNFARDHTLFAATTLGGLYVSRDSGAVWSPTEH